MQKATQQLTNHSQLGNTRRDIARAKTIQAEQKRAGRRPSRREEDRSQEMNADVTIADAPAPPRAEPRAKNTRTLIGKVVSDKRSKTITVLIERRTKHELYGKIVAKSEQVPRARRERRVQARRRRRDRREPADLEDQVVGRDAPGAEGRRRSAQRAGRAVARSVSPRHTKETHMIKVGDKLPAGTLQEFVEVEGNGCSIGPNTFDVARRPPARRSRSSACPAPSRRPARPSTCRATSSRPTS